MSFFVSERINVNIKLFEKKSAMERMNERKKKKQNSMENKFTRAMGKYLQLVKIAFSFLWHMMQNER